MAVTSYKTFTFINDTGQKANGLRMSFVGRTEIVSVNGKPPEGLGHGDYSASGNGTNTPNIQDLEIAPEGKLRVRVKGNISIQAKQCYWMKDGKKLKPLKIPKNLVATSPQAKASPDFKFRVP